ncbi:MAG: iron uptake porin [Pleurocapsa sp.]
MSKLFWQTLKIAPAIAVASLLTANGAIAQSAPTSNESNNSVNQTLETINQYQKEGQNRSMSQVTNVNQLRDVAPTDWAYEALRSLVDRYGCISGFPNQTFRGNQALSRYEFAAGLNSCLNQIERLIASSESVVREDVDTINRLAQEFEAELATIGGRIDNIESRTAFLEDHQFSTTTKLSGEAIFAVGNVFGDTIADEATGDPGDPRTDLESEFTFTDRVRLNFDSSFTGEDRLRVRLEAGNLDTAFKEGISGTNSTRVGFDAGGGNSVKISDIYYRFPVNDRITGYVGTTGLDLDDIFAVTNPMLESSGTGALSRFSRRNPVVLRGTEGAGAGVSVELIEDKVTVTGLYLADGGGDAATPEERKGLFNGSFSAGGQIEVTPIEDLNVAATYVRSYETDGGDFSGGTVSGAAADPFNGQDTGGHRVGLGVDYTFQERFVLAGWGGYARATQLKGVPAGQDDPSGNVWSWGANISVLDLVKEGSALTIAGGMLPKFVSDDARPNGPIVEDQDTSYLVEALYKFPLNDNILITPGAYVVFNADHNSDNDTLVVGVLRTTFKF